MVAAVSPVGAGHVGMIVLALQAQGEVVRRHAHQHRPIVFAGRIGALFVGKHALVKPFAQFHERLAVLGFLVPVGGAITPDAFVRLALGFGQAMTVDVVGYALPADALHIIQRHRHVFGAEVQVDLAPVVAVRFRAPCRACHAMADVVILDVRKGGRGVLFGYHALHGLRQRLQARM
ncbi:hypothetical protein D3C72_1426100 [compost metagenome]